jgi:hypothetical protein
MAGCTRESFSCYSRTMRAVKNIFLSICFIMPVTAVFGQTGATQDIKAAGGSAKTALVKTGSATGKVTVKGVKATGRGLKWTGRKLALGTGAGIEKSGAALKSVGK